MATLASSLSQRGSIARQLGSVLLDLLPSPGEGLLIRRDLIRAGTAPDIFTQGAAIRA
jgi:hypothetical protein